MALDFKFRIKLVLILMVVALIQGVCADKTLASDLALTRKTKIHFADEGEAIRELNTVDIFIESLSPFDRSSRMKTDKIVSQGEFIQFVGSQARPWSTAEVEKLSPLILSLGEKIESLGLNLPPVVNLVKTTGAEEGQVPYYRGNSIVEVRELSKEFQKRGFDITAFRDRLSDRLGLGNSVYSGGGLHRTADCRQMFIRGTELAQYSRQTFRAVHLLEAIFAAPTRERILSDSSIIHARDCRQCTFEEEPSGEVRP